MNKKLMAYSIVFFIVALSAAACIKISILKADAIAEESFSRRQSQVEQVIQEIKDKEEEQAAREESDKAYRIQLIEQQAQEELEKRLEEAKLAEEQVETNAGNMWKNQQIDYITGNGALSKLQGVNYYNNRRETWYSSRVLYHKDTANWTPDANGVYRDSDGYVVIASSDHAQGSLVDTSHGMGKVYDSGCASGTTDIYVNW